ncbi:MAG: phage tail tape measure protein [bacterium]|nr:phage tail tape measure protein [bacterium]
MLSGFTSAITISVFGTSNLSAFTAASKRLNKFAGNFEKASERVRKAGLKTMLVGAGIAASLAMPILQFGKFATQVERTGGIAEATAQQVKAIGDTAMYLGAKSSFTAQQVAEGQESLASMGLTADQVSLKTGIMADTIAFATGQQVEMADAGAMLVGTLNAYQKPMSDATRVGDLFTAAMNKSNLKFGDMQESVTNTASTMSSFGQSIETNLALLGVLSNRNEIGARAGTRLAMTMTKVYTQGDKVNKVLGVNPYDKVTGKTRDFIEVFGELKDKLGTMTEEKKNVAITDLFGAEGVKVFNILLSSSREELMGMRSDIAGAEGSMAAFEKRILDTPVGHWNLMKSAVDGVSMTIGGHLMPLVMRMVDGIKGIADAMFEWMRAHPLLTKFVTGFALVAAVGLILGGALLLVGGGLMHIGALALQLPAKLGQIAFSMGVTNSAAVPLTASLKALGLGALKMIAPFALVGLALYAIVKAWDTNFMGFRTTVEAVWTAIKPTVMGIWDMMKAFGDGVATVFDKTIGAAWRWADGWRRVFMSGTAPILRLAGVVAYCMGFMVGTIIRAWGWIKDHPIITGQVFAALAALSWPFIWSAVTAVWVFATQTVIAGGVAAWGFLVARVAAIRAGIAYAWTAGMALLMAAATGIWTVAQWALNVALTANPIGLVIAGIAAFGAIIGIIANKVGGFRNLLNIVWSGFLWGIKTVAKLIFWPITLIKVLYEKFQPVRDFLDGMWDGFKSGINGVIGLINAFIKGINLIPGVEIPLIPKLKTGTSLGADASGLAAAVGKHIPKTLVKPNEKPVMVAQKPPAFAATSGSLGEWSGFAGGMEIGIIPAAAVKPKRVAAMPGSLAGMDMLMAAAQPADLKPARAGVGARPGASISNRTSTTHVDRRISVAKIEVTSGPNVPATDMKKQLEEAFRAIAGQEDGLEGVRYAN